MSALQWADMSNALNFSGGPGALPAHVLAQASEAIRAVPETGISVLGMSHRTPWFRAVVDEAEDNIRALLGIPPNYHVLFMQGGGSLQFAMLPMSFLRGTHRPADYLVSGYWSAKAPPEASSEGAVQVAWDGADEGYRRIPEPSELRLSPNAAYLHYVSNETVEGLSFGYVPDTNGAPLVCDMSSDLLAAPIDVTRYAMIYAHAQKNLGPSGVTVVIIQDGFLQTAASGLPSILDYRVHLAARSIYNTPPVFAIYVLMLVTRWLRHTIGGLTRIAELNRIKAQLVHAALDAFPDIYRVHGEPACRSQTNIAFRLASATQEQAFLQEAARRGFTGLEGHRSIGGLRASLYNAVTVEAAAQLADFIREWSDAPR
jgi:phosphoserine aminotransferase